MAGVSDQIGRGGEAPALSNVPVADLLGGSLTSAMGLLAALFDAQRTGCGRHVDIAMADAMLAHAVVPMLTLAVHGQTRPAGADRLSGALPCYSVYRTGDGRHLAVGALERKFWDRFCDVIGREDLKPLHLPKDAATADSVRSDLAELIGSRTLAEWHPPWR
ncbi:CoA transferase [Schlegelella sp. S2-27]|uniref:CoA transferase n=1 Tax=Caldimonas mangrovi TaxID=2944811 RepID=A0ABT0YVX5_9BURK|nr:CoA transferase [Caldimonas mangrovi]MCM5682902.1 CoA transferase [Caldimonas mangrovi]